MREYLKYLKGDSVIWIIAILMLAFSLVTVYSFVPILIKIEGGSLLNTYTNILCCSSIFLNVWIHMRNPKYFLN